MEIALSDSLTHFDDAGASRMVDVGGKPVTYRRAVASGLVRMEPNTLHTIENRGIAKGNVYEVARLAGIQAAKRTWELIPLCHLLPLEKVEIGFETVDDRTLRATATVSTHAKTGVEMEALTAVTVAALTVYDMCKAIDRGMEIGPFRLEHKAGGKSGEFSREADV